MLKKQIYRYFYEYISIYSDHITYKKSKSKQVLSFLYLKINTLKQKYFYY